ncbi:MAG: YlxR family protein [Actinomycetota bacterium]
MRFVRTSSATVEVDPRAAAPGRGGYTCRSSSCLERALHRGSLARVLRVGISSEDVARLYEQAVEYL